MKIQKLANLALSAEQFSAIDATQTTMEGHFAGLVSLTRDEKKGIRTMGLRSEAFCRRMLEVMQQNPHLLPPKVVLADAIADLETYARLRGRVERMSKLLERAVDTLFALSGNVYSVALAGYGQLRRFGDNEGLKQTSLELGAMFATSAIKTKARRAAVVAAGTSPAPAKDPAA